MVVRRWIAAFSPIVCSPSQVISVHYSPYITLSSTELVICNHQADCFKIYKLYVIWSFLNGLSQTFFELQCETNY